MGMGMASVRILIVDDDENIRAAIAAALKVGGLSANSRLQQFGRVALR